MNVEYSDIVNKVLVDQRDESLVDGRLMILRSESKEFKCIFDRKFAWHCPFGLYTLEFHLLDYLVEDLERF